MTHQKNVPAPEQNPHCRVPKITKKRPQNPHLTHQMTQGLTHHLGHKSVSGSLLAEMAVIKNKVNLFNKHYSFRFLPLSTSLVKDDQMTVYKMAALTGMAHSLNFTSSTI
jgi:hypothetical protein